jgi:hypothetical protein
MDKKRKQMSDREIEQRRDDILRTMLHTPPQPNWRPTNIRKKAKPKKENARRGG